MEAPEDLQRLARFALDRRRALGLDQHGVPGLGATTISKVENARFISPRSRRKLEIAYGWRPFYADHIAAGRDPEEQDDSAAKRLPAKEAPDVREKRQTTTMTFFFDSSLFTDSEREEILEVVATTAQQMLNLASSLRRADRENWF